ncbi:MAG TPA: hypothetical protein VG432_15125 [Gemmatimonadaceae bacterium]|nr:hypothetical protein [Gemmatimonadaceae bacterium]
MARSMSLVGAALLIAGLANSARADSLPRPLSAVDSVAVLKQARRAQRDFESRRFMLLPVVPSAGSRCDVRVGRWCYWQDDAEDAPGEPKKIADLRSRFLDRLASLAARVPGDRWISGQRVRYLSEARRGAEAVAVARDCRAEPSWCASLAVIAYRAAGDIPAADSALSAALAAMPEEQRCAALDIGPLIEGTFRDRYRAASCSERDSLTARWLWLARGSYADSSNEVRVEIFSRRLFAQLASESTSPYGPITAPDLRELVLRYGWSESWGRSEPGAGLTDRGTAVGFDGPHTFALAPDDGALADLSTIGDPPRLRNDPTARARFPIHGTRTLGGLAHRLALFRRGDSTLAIAAYDASADTAMRGVDSATVAFALLRDEHTAPVVARAVHGTRGIVTAMAPWRPALVAVELRDSASSRAARARIGVPLGDTASGRVGLSDLLLFAADSDMATALDSVVSRAIVDGRIPGGARLGIFWEMYGLDQGERVTASVGLIPDQSGFLRRAAERAHLVEPRTPIHLRWEDAPEVIGSVGGRILTLGLDGVAEGSYTVELTLSVEGQPTRRAASRVRIVSP